VRQSALTGASTYDVLTRSYNNQRTGATLVEPTLTTANVNAAQFGKLFSVYADDQVYGQILVRQGLNIPGKGVHDAFFVTTVKGSIFAYDVATGQSLWFSNYIPPGYQATQIGDEACSNGGNNFTTYDALVGTPVIDPSTNIMYFVVRSKWNGNIYQYIHGINITTGQDQLTPINLSGFIGPGNTTFNAQIQNPRAALTLSNGYVYANWGSYCDANAWHGWTMGFNASNLSPTGISVTGTSSNAQAGIWQGGGGMAVGVDGSLFAATGNGPVQYGLGFSLVKFNWPSLSLEDTFTSWMLSHWPGSNDMDFGSSGPVLLPPNFDLATVGAKDGNVYVINTVGLGGYVLNDTQIPQRLPAVQGGGEIHGSNVAWVGPDGDTYLYVWGDGDYVRRYRLQPGNNAFDQPASDVGPILPGGAPAGTLSLSSNGAVAGSGILWATTPSQDSGSGFGGPGVLRAFNAENLALLWQSTDSWSYAKFNPPVVSNGRVYVPTFSNAVDVYGIIQSTPVHSGQLSILRQRNSTFPAICVDAAGVTTQVTNLVEYFCNGGNAQAWQFNQIGSGWQIVRAGSGMCMDVPGGNAFVGQVVQQAPCNEIPEQNFSLFSAQDGMKIMFGGYCVTLPKSSSPAGTLLQLSICTGGSIVANDTQVVSALPSQIRKQNSGLPGMCVDVPYATQSPGTQLQTYTCNAGENQSWQQMFWPDGSHGLVRNRTNLCFDIPYGDAYVGAVVQQYTCNGGSSQKFYLDEFPNGYQIRFADTQNLCVDVPGNSNSPNQLLRLWNCNGTDAQIFSLFPPQIRKATSGTAPGICLAGSGSSQMTYAPCDGTASQNWSRGIYDTLATPSGGATDACIGIQTSTPYSQESLYPNVLCLSNGPNQWLFQPDATNGSAITMEEYNFCLDAPWGWNTVQNAQIFTCNGAVSQQWTP
jgi:hypothetical protein